MKSGLDYFPLDVCLDEKFELIEAEFGLTGFAVVVKLLQRIYGQQGYYCEWTNEVALLFGKSLGLNAKGAEPGGNVVSEIVTASIKRGIFDKTLFDKYHILTSHGIQKRYFEAVNRRKIVEVKKDYLLLSDTSEYKNVHIISENVNISDENADIYKQSKGEESKGKKSKVEDIETGESSPCPYSEIQKLYSSICRSYPKLTKLSDARKKAIHARFTSGYKLDDFKRLFEMAESSTFLKGHNNRNWQATFDWLIKDANMAKVLDGNYEDRGGNSARQPSNGTGNYGKDPAGDPGEIPQQYGKVY